LGHYGTIHRGLSADAGKTEMNRQASPGKGEVRQMKILILGGDGMLGHQLVESMAPRFEVHGTLRGAPDAYSGIAASLPPNAHYSLDVRNIAAIDDLLREVRPSAVINAVGIVKQRDGASDAIESIQINALFPHQLAQCCASVGARLVHISTDCVFSGQRGMYQETMAPDVNDLYGRSKALGEVTNGRAITLRTSIIGLELARRTSLIEWFLSQRGTVKGYTRAIYSGFTTLEFARIIEQVLVDHPNSHGLYHVATDPIDKFTLLQMLNDRLGHPVEIVPDDAFVCDRSLDGSRFRADFGYSAPSWGRMLDELAAQIKERYG
jgi:dTDP-4-dehydrorhamnose reductase